MARRAAKAEAAGSPGGAGNRGTAHTWSDGHVVGIGSSAGGLEALQNLVAALVPCGRAAYVVAQHLAPDHRSLIVDLLARATSLKVVPAVDGAPLQADVIVVAPPNHDVTVVGDRIKVASPKARFGPSPSIDLLFESIAEQWGAKGVAVVLSGTGSDGAHGLRAVRAAGGLTVVQAPESAKFDGMPRAAIALGGADLVVEAGEIGLRLAALVGGGGGWSGDGLPQPKAEVLSEVAARLKRVMGIDFSGYKPTTLRRQLQRRMAIRQVSQVDDYLPLLAADSDEARALAHNLLVNVTAFFRDPEAFTALAGQLRRYVEARGSAGQFRVWVPGCATGEEVYTIAMLFSEVLGHPVHLARQLKIFGTDLDEASLATARRGLYPRAAAQAIPEALRQRFLVENGQGVEIQEVLRECAVFARHNVTEDPPFPRLDLISCRNTLIYFTRPLQDHVLNLFRYGLLPDGLLMLGISEGLGNRTPGFEVADVDHRLYRRTQEANRPVLPLTAPAATTARAVIPAAGASSASRVAIIRDAVPEQHTALLEALVRSVCAPCLVLDEHHDLVEVVGDVSPYCRLPEGRITTAAGSFLRPELQSEARALFLMARADGVPLISRALALDGLEQPVRLQARPLAVNGRELTVLSFVGAGEPAPRVVEGDATFAQELERLERELLASQDCLRRSLAELEAANEELEASSEELQASSEELQSSNEELEASNEELQATNEELGIVNQQLRLHGEEQQLLNTDLENIQASLNQGMVILDGELRVTRYSPLAVRVFALVESDIGQPLTGIPTTMPLPGLAEALQAVVSGGTRCNIEASGEGGAYLVQVLPYRDAEGRRHGAIVTLTDVSELVELRNAARSALEEFTNLTDALEEAVWKRDPAMEQLLYASERMGAISGWEAAELLAQPGLLDQAIHPEDRAAVQEARQSGPRWSVRYRLCRRDGRQLWVNETATVVQRGGDHFVVGTLADVSRQRLVEERAEDMAAIFESVFQTQVFGVAVLDQQSKVVMGNDTFCRMVGFDAEAVAGLSLDLLTEPSPPAVGEADTGAGAAALSHGPSEGLRTLQLRSRSGRLSWVTAETTLLERPIGDSVALVVLQDVTALRETTQQLLEQARLDAPTGLLNRAFFADSLKREISRCQRDGSSLALAWIDLDHFKEVNDLYGHDAGDVVLQTVSSRLQQVVRGQDCVGRLGGDEFGVLISGYGGIGELESLLERLITVLREPIATSDGEFRVGGSIGVALCPSDAGEMEGLLAAADAAMYSVKAKGGNSIEYFTRAMNEAAERRYQLRQQLLAAIAAEEFELHYQPILNLADGRIWGAEALLRWRRGEELVSAADFVTFAEESGLLRQLSPLIMRLLRLDLEQLQQRGHGELPVAVNMSVRQLEDPRLVQQLSSWPAPQALAGLVVEVLETVFLPDNSKALATLQILGRQGAEISIDDYGSGATNLRLLQALRPRYIKLERSFLALGSRDSQGTALLRSAVAMGHAIGAGVVIEAVEGEADLALAQAIGADYGQGYHLAPPMSLAALLTWLEQTPQGQPGG